MAFKFNFKVQQTEEEEGDDDNQDIQSQNDNIDNNNDIEKINENEAKYIEFNQNDIKQLLKQQTFQIDTIQFKDGIELKKLSKPTTTTDTLNNVLTENKTDLIPGVYEGGFKLWECAIDLINYIIEQSIPLQGLKVLEIGCGHGLPALFCRLNNSIVTCQDYNEEVIKTLTQPNTILNDIQNNVTFISGDWKHVNQLLGKEKFDLILTSDTIYSVQSFQKLHDLIVDHLTDDGLCLVAAKTFYFGVGGSTHQFKNLVDKNLKLKVIINYYIFRSTNSFSTNSNSYISISNIHYSHKKQLRMKTIILSIVLALLSLLYFPVSQQQSPTYQPRTPLQVAQILGGAVTFQTISYDPSDLEHPVNYTEFNRFISYLEQSFPLVHQHLNKTIVGGYSLVFEWKGSNTALKPLFLNSHYDVVPVTAAGWGFPPFGGAIANGRVYGRGAIDNKLLVVSILEAVESLLGRGNFQPKRTIYVCIGHDEEIGGYNGHLKISRMFQAAGVQAEAVLDEGFPILNTSFLQSTPAPLPARPTAIIGVFEKGYVYYNLTAKAAGGHSSMPPVESAIGIMAQATLNIERNPFTPIPNPKDTNYFLRQFTDEQIASIPFLKYQDRTTTAITMIRGGIKPNVIPTDVTLWINHRVVPGDNTSYVIERVNQLINDSRVVMTIDAVLPPSPVSCINCTQFKNIRKALSKAYPDIDIVPGLMVANTDTRWYWNVTSNLYRLTPSLASAADYATIHGFNESVPIDSIAKGVKFYKRVIKIFDKTKNNKQVINGMVDDDSDLELDLSLDLDDLL
ncbi:peptidase M20 family protein [Cavenderia fasciculata]|uniref:Peptidase M20 family protein n=1 Tax=Cavenderia fasciculata TaxID=261658 RepID=F4PJU1_CACFS|nr:peptidase M20 family protein [Cavenderia fasciculata]EGG23865.1 peptidase M20 family protein [Cavenderia fasciculata]|eukprot:XP_004361716.1 peptidase M20 family protein [Cavenderia fasciculata]